MTPEEKKFMRSKKPQKRQMTAQEWGREGMRRRWGKHGETKSVRAFSATVDRFRAAVPHERDRAAAATAALDAYLDGKGAPRVSKNETVPVRIIAPGEKPVTINAVLTYHWYDEIAAGRKRTEYRDICPYWDAKLWDNGITERIAAIRFSRGYTDTRMTWEVTEINRNEDEGVYEIHLGKRLA